MFTQPFDSPSSIQYLYILSPNVKGKFYLESALLRLACTISIGLIEIVQAKIGADLFHIVSFFLKMAPWRHSELCGKTDSDASGSSILLFIPILWPETVRFSA